MNRRNTYCIITLFLITLPILNLSPLELNSVYGASSNWLLENYSFSSSTGSYVYPGSMNTLLVLTMRYVGLSEAINPLACLNAPRGFQLIDKCTPARDPEDNVISTISRGSIVYFRFRMNIERSVNPGNYSVVVNVTFFNTGDNKLYWETISVEVEISPYPPLNLEIIDTYFSPYNYPGARYVNVIIGFVNRGETSISSLRLILNLPRDLAEPSELNYTYVLTIQPGEEVYLSLGPVFINPDAKPNTRYTALLRTRAQLVTSDNVIYSDEKNYTISLITGNISVVKLIVLTYELTSSIALPGLRNTGLRILIQSLEESIVSLQYSRVVFENAELINGSSTAIYIHEEVLDYFDLVWLTYSGINLFENVSYIRINTTIYGIVTRDGVEYPFELELLFTIPLKNRELDIFVEKTQWSRVFAYPGSTGNDLIISILNNESILTITDAIVEVETFNTTYPSKLTSYNVLIESSSITEVVFTNIVIPESIKPGVYEILLRINGILRCIDNSFKHIVIHRRSFIIITNYSNLEPILPIFTILDAYWGEFSPQYVYPGNARAPLTIILQNNGIVTVSNTILIINNIEPSDVIPLNSVAQCSLQLTPGSICSTVFYMNLTNSSSGLKTISIVVKYSLDQLGLNIIFTQRLTISIYLPSYPPSGGITIVNYSWLNNYPVFNGSKKTVLLITIANLEPYSVSSIWITLRTPTGINIHRGFSNVVYVAGPVLSLQTETVSFTLDLDCSPGVYQITVEFDYFIHTDYGGVRRKYRDYVSIYIEDGVDGIELIRFTWLTTPQPPPVYGARLLIVFRNVKYPSITNPVLKLKLPEGIVESSTNSSEPVLLPIVISNIQQLFLNQIVPVNIADLLSQYIQYQYPTSVSKGDFIAYVVSLNIEKNYTVINIPYTLMFIDHWGEDYAVRSVFTVRLLTTPALINIYPKTPLIVFANGTAVLELVLENNYDSPVANLYLVLIPVSGNVIPMNALKYISKLDGRTSRVVKYELIYNPVQTQFSSIQLSSLSAIFTVSLIYTDITGVIRSINTTFAVIVKPFIELTILPGVSAKYSKDTLTINGIIANTGLSTARSVVAYLKYGEYETLGIIGDLDPSSQTPFRLEIKTPYVNDTCILIIKYLDEYGIEYYLRRELRINVVSEDLNPVIQPRREFDITRYLIIAIIIVFLTAVFIVIYRYSKKAVRESTL